MGEQQQAARLGAASFRRDEPCAPALDNELSKLLETATSGRVGSAVPLLKAWSAGWMAANLAAPLQ